MGAVMADGSVSLKVAGANETSVVLHMAYIEEEPVERASEQERRFCSQYHAFPQARLVGRTAVSSATRERVRVVSDRTCCRSRSYQSGHLGMGVTVRTIGISRLAGRPAKEGQKPVHERTRSATQHSSALLTPERLSMQRRIRGRY